MTLTSSSHSDERVNHTSWLRSWASRPPCPPSPKSHHSAEWWCRISRGERHWIKLFDVWLHSLNVFTSLQKCCHENTFIKEGIKYTLCSIINNKKHDLSFEELFKIPSKNLFSVKKERMKMQGNQGKPFYWIFLIQTMPFTFLFIRQNRFGPSMTRLSSYSPEGN